MIRIASRLGRTIRGLLHGHLYDVLSPAEYYLWKAYYSLEPYSNETKHLVFIEAAVLKTDHRRILPPECELDQPLEDMNVEQSQQSLARQLTMMAMEHLPESVKADIKSRMQ